MQYSKLQQINRTNSKFKKILSSILFFLTFQPFKAASIYLLHKSKVVFYKLSETDEISFLDICKNVLIKDRIENFTFYKSTKKVLEIEHSTLEKNIPLIIDKEVITLYDFLKKRQTKFERPKKIGFWSIIELIFMS